MDGLNISNFDYPLKGETAKFEYKLVNQNGKLSDVALHRKYQKLTLLESKNPADNLEVRDYETSQQQQQPLTIQEVQENRRKRNAGEDCGDDLESFVSCDETASSDAESYTQSLSHRTNSLGHPPTKKRLTSNDPLSSASRSGPLQPASAVANAVPSNNAAGQGGVGGHYHMQQNVVHSGAVVHSSSVNRDHGHRPRTPNQINSPNHIPISDVEEEQTQQPPLPSPSASPTQSDTEAEQGLGSNSPRSTSGKYNMALIESHMSKVPTTQAELVNVITNLTQFLAEENQNHLLFKLLQRTSRSSLSTFNGLIHNSLKRDLIGNLPFEVAMKVLSYLDYQTLVLLGRVCKKWFQIINNTQLWVQLIKKDKLITDDATIKAELGQCDSLLHHWCTMPNDINPAQVLYKKRKSIVNRWLDPTYKPKRISVKGHGNKVVTCLQHDEEKIVTGVDDKCILIYSTKTGQLMKVLEGHEGGVWALKYSGNTLVTGSTDRTVRVWNMNTGRCTHIFRGHTSTIRCLDIINPTVIGKDASGEDIVYPEYPLLVTGSRDHNIHVWKLPILGDQDCETPVFDGGEIDNPYLITILSGHTQSVRSISGHGNIIISGSYDSTVRVWDLLDNGECKHVLQGHNDRVYSTAMDFDKKICFSGSMDSTINLWNFETGELLRLLQGHGSLVGLLALVDGVLVSAAADASLRIWDPSNGDLKSELKGHSAAITCFEHDGLKVVSGSEKMLKLWDVERGVFARDLLSDVTGGIWQVRMDYKRCVAAVQRFGNVEEGETFIEILDFSEPPELNNQ
ncbi:uncharacterized protein LODBEIA_P08840 [Lodderomyces beijingensis]|uniref:F-box domain-containing protein n=1 Tax=Lodderomyces beijingensis TaxID=1775926 RepID=A0ABP0ZK39_9ASCO